MISIQRPIYRRTITLLFLFSFSSAAQATWSIVAVDETTGEVGMAAATCGLGVHFIASISPGNGVVAAQGATSFKGRDMAIEWMYAGDVASDILSRLQDEEFYDGWFDRDVDDIQYGVATLSGGTGAGFIDGANLEQWSGGFSTDAFSVQGNTLRSADVVRVAADAMQRKSDGSCSLTLGERLLRGLEAGRDAGGDNRCPLDRPANSAVMLLSKGEATANSADSTNLRLVTPKEIGIPQAIYHGIFPYKPEVDTPEPIAHLRTLFSASGGRVCRPNTE